MEFRLLRQANRPGLLQLISTSLGQKLTDGRMDKRVEDLQPQPPMGHLARCPQPQQSGGSGGANVYGATGQTDADQSNVEGHDGSRPSSELYTFTHWLHSMSAPSVLRYGTLAECLWATRFGVVYTVCAPQLLGTWFHDHLHYTMICNTIQMQFDNALLMMLRSVH